MKIKLSEKVEQKLLAIDRQINLLKAEKKVMIDTVLMQSEKEGEIEKIEGGHIFLKEIDK